MDTLNQRRRWSLAVAAAATLLVMPTMSVMAQTSVAGVILHTGPSEAVDAWSRAVEAGDVAAIARMNGPQTVAYGLETAVTKGTAAITADYASMFERYRAKVEIRDATWVRQGSLLSSWGQFTLLLTPRAGGEPVRIDGRFSDLAVWKEGHWQYLLDHASVPAR